MIEPIPLNQTNVWVFVEPLSDNLFEGNETVILNLTQTNDDYLINSNLASATITIADTTTTVAVSAGNNGTEPNSASNIPGQTGFFSLTRADSRGFLPALTVTYQMSGAAINSNNMDYTNLTGTVTIPLNQTNAFVYVQPVADELIEGDETVKLTLTQTGDAYLINSNSGSATISIIDNLPTNLFQTVITNLAAPVGIDYHAPSNRLIVSFNYYNSGQPSGLASI